MPSTFTARTASGTATSVVVMATGAILLCATAAAAGTLLIRRRDRNQDQDEGTTNDAAPKTTSTSTTTAEGRSDNCIPKAASTSRSLSDGPSTGGGMNGSLFPNKKTKRILTPGTITITYASTTGTCLKFASILEKTLLAATNRKKKAGMTPNEITTQTGRVEEFDWWDELLNPNDDEEEDEEKGDVKSSSSLPPPPPPIVIFVLSTHTGGTLPPESTQLLESLRDIANDWRIPKKPLRSTELRVSVFGMGSSAYDADTFCKPARAVWSIMGMLGAVRMGELGMADDAVGDSECVFHTWMRENVVTNIDIHLGDDGSNDSSCTDDDDAKSARTVPVAGEEGQEMQKNKVKNKSGSCTCAGKPTTNGGNKMSSQRECCQTNPSHQTDDHNGCCQTANTDQNEKKDNNDSDDSDDDDESYVDSDDEDNRVGEPEVMDLEEIGPSLQRSSYNASSSSSPSSVNQIPKEMVTPKQAAALKKEGYKLIGTHSAVKLCRWTKHQLRGRGGCYKHTFYGITSYQCMEATPSLACANKCVFCWRHHKNPVGKEWKWKTDDPHYIVSEAINLHVSMIKEARGIPGVKPDRWQEAHTVRHCALSLVGEPIMYPRIDELLADLHSRKISSFLVTNGQHPDAIGRLRPVTQLYVSVDAPTPESLEAIDRPLFHDAWGRLKRSLSCLKGKGQRTVARLTVVKGWNMDEVEGYAKLIALGQCSLVEVKGVTFCGKSDASNLNMSNTPWHHEVVSLTQTLQKELAKLTANGGPNAPPEYGLACEHKHSCSVLLARADQFAVDDPVTGERRWRTWIDYDKFHELSTRNASDPSFTFSVRDYTAETPSWALFGSEEEGFDPTDTRHRKKKKHPKYTKFDDEGVPTHDHNGVELSVQERKKLIELMEERRREIAASAGGSSVVVKDLGGGAKAVEDASLMFRGMVVAK